jgi:hypothetical protein
VEDFRVRRQTASALVSWLTPEQASVFDKYAIDVRQQNEAGVRRWRRELRTLRDSNLRNLVVVVRP